MMDGLRNTLCEETLRSLSSKKTTSCLFWLLSATSSWCVGLNSRVVTWLLLVSHLFSPLLWFFSKTWQIPLVPCSDLQQSNLPVIAPVSSSCRCSQLVIRTLHVGQLRFPADSSYSSHEGRSVHSIERVEMLIYKSSTFSSFSDPRAKVDFHFIVRLCSVSCLLSR